jgi:hypothetical protein
MERQTDKACNMNGEQRSVYRLLVETPKEKRPLGRARRGWVNTVKMILER